MVTPANAALLESWQLSLHGKAPGTVRLYMAETGRFTAWLEARRVHSPDEPGDLLAVGRRDVESWFSELRANGLSNATMRARWIAMRSFYGWAVEEDELETNPMERVRVEKGNAAPVAVVSSESLRALLKACEGRTLLDRRDMALFRLMAGTGLRLAEVADLTVEDIDLTNRLVVVRHGKGDKARVVRFDPATAAALDRYKRARARHTQAATPWLWLSPRGRLRRGSIPAVLNKRAKVAGIAHIHPHQLRHTFADRWLARGGSEGDLQRLGGWESAEVMRRYGSARAVDRALSAYDSVNPLEGL